MDFLDPVAKKKRGLRLLVGYVLMGILLLTATTVLVYRSYGFGVDRGTGEVIQNGLVYIDSAPDKAAVYLNGELKGNQTNARYSLTAGKYELVIKKDGYRDWSKNFELSGGSVQRLTYPLLIAKDLEKLEVSIFGASLPKTVTESPDRRWIISQVGANFRDFNEYDLANEDAQKHPAVRTITFPEEIFTAAADPGSLEMIEWSTDNKHILVRHNYAAGYEFVILNREKPEESVNVNKTLGVSPTQITLRDKKFDKWYLYTATGGLLQTADSQKNIQTVLEKVTSYKTHDADIILYAQADNKGGSTIYLKDKQDTQELRSVGAGAVKLNVAGYNGAWYAAIASDGDARTYIYKDPTRFIRQLDNQKPVPLRVVKYSVPISELEFSANARFILIRSADKIHVFDLEKNETYNYDNPAKTTPNAKLSWMDGHRLMINDGGTITIFDFDGGNLNRLVDLITGDAFFDRDYTVMYTAGKQNSAAANTSLLRSSLRFIQDKVAKN